MTSRAVTRVLDTSFTPAMFLAVSLNSSAGLTSMMTLSPWPRDDAASPQSPLSSPQPPRGRSTTTTAPSWIFCVSAAASAPRRTFFDNAKS